MKKKIALITGVTGQDGSYLAEFLLNKNYIVHGIKRRSSSYNTKRIDHIFEDIEKKNKKFFIHFGDITDSTNIISLVNNIKPDEIYNLAAQSHVKVSFETPEYTANSDALGTLRILEAIRILDLKKTKFYQASTSELYGNSKKKLLDEKSPFCPVSPYATSKLYAYWITKNYRHAYNIFASNGILFNHESKRRGETFVTRKIVIGIGKILRGEIKKIYLGNIDAFRDWGHAIDYVKGMWLILQHQKPDDFVLSTGKSYSVRNFVEIAFKYVGIEIEWKGKGINEKGFNKKDKKCLIEIDRRYFRPNEVEYLRGNSKKAMKELGWKCEFSFHDLVKEMINEELK